MMQTRATVGEQRVRIWLDRTDCWYWEADWPWEAKNGRPHGGYATMRDAFEAAQRALGADVRVVQHFGTP